MPCIQMLTRSYKYLHDLYTDRFTEVITDTVTDTATTHKIILTLHACKHDEQHDNLYFHPNDVRLVLCGTVLGNINTFCVACSSRQTTRAVRQTPLHWYVKGLTPGYG